MKLQHRKVSIGAGSHQRAATTAKKKIKHQPAVLSGGVHRPAAEVPLSPGSVPTLVEHRPAALRDNSAAHTAVEPREGTSTHHQPATFPVADDLDARGDGNIDETDDGAADEASLGAIEAPLGVVAEARE